MQVGDWSAVLLEKEMVRDRFLPASFRRARSVSWRFKTSSARGHRSRDDPGWSWFDPCPRAITASLGDADLAVDDITIRHEQRDLLRRVASR